MVGRVNSELRPRPGPPGRHIALASGPAPPAVAAGRRGGGAVRGRRPGGAGRSVRRRPGRNATYSILGAKFDYRLLWVLAVSTMALIVFHELGARMGVVTEKGLLALVRDHYGPRGAIVALTALVVANLGRLCAEFAGVATGLDLLAGSAACVSVPLAAIGVSLLVPAGLVPPRRVRPARALKRLHRLRRLGLARPSRTGEPPRAAWSCPACR